MPPRIPGLDVLLSRSPLRAPGLGLLLAGAACLAAGRARSDLVLTLAGSVALATLPLLAGLALARALLLRRRFLETLDRASGELHGEAGRPLPTGVRVRRPRVPLAREGEIAWERPPGRSRFREGEEGIEELFAVGRILTDGEVGRVVVGDLLGAFRWRLPVTTDRRVHLLPPRPDVSLDTLLRALASGDQFPHPEGPREGDRVDSRPYAPGDPARLILWKAWARRRELLVRSPETALDPRDRSLLICLVAGPGDEDAAGLARLLAEELLPTARARLAADGSPEPVDDLPAALAAISRSADARDRSGDVLALAAEAAREGDAVLVVCSADPVPCPGRLLATAAGGAGELAVLAVGRATPHPPSRGRLARWILRDPPGGPTREALLAGLAPLAGGSLRPALVDVTTGKVIPVPSAGGAR